VYRTADVDAGNHLHALKESSHPEKLKGKPSSTKKERKESSQWRMASTIARREAKGDEEAEGESERDDSELSFALAVSPSSCCSFQRGANPLPAALVPHLA
jgi:hypothetical protein